MQPIKLKTMTEQEIDSFNKNQKLGKFHPLTCDRVAEDCEVFDKPRDYSKDGGLIATSQGLVCPCGKYKQHWAYDFNLQQ